MLFLVLLVSVEIILKTYDHFNPRCDFMINPVAENLDYDFKKDVCNSWKVRLTYIDPISGISQSVPNQHFLTFNINNHGFRGPEIFIEKPDDTYRIFVVGGSTTFSIRALSDQHTIPGYLQQKFDEAGLDKKIEVINAGIGSMTSNDELQLVKTKIVTYDPDLIIIYDGYNDVVNFPGKTKNKLEDDIFVSTWRTFFNFYDTPYVLEGIIEKSKNSAFPLFFNTEYEKKALTWKENMIEICDIGKEEGFDTVVALQPFLGTGNKVWTDHEMNMIEKSSTLSGMKDGYQFFADELDELKNYCSITIDLRNSFDDIAESVFFDKAHVSSDSNKIITVQLFEMVKPLVSNQTN